jgi:hypothetical protein
MCVELLGGGRVSAGLHGLVEQKYRKAHFEIYFPSKGFPTFHSFIRCFVE